MKTTNVPDTRDERLVKTFWLGAIAFVIVAGLVWGGKELLSSPVSVQAHCNIDLDWAINQACEFEGETLRHCPLPTNVQCDIAASGPLIAILGGTQ